MNTQSKTTAGRGWLAVGVLLASVVWAAPALAQGGPPGCSAQTYNGLNVSPAAGQTLLEFSGPTYQPVTIALRTNKNLPAGGSYAWTQVNPALPLQAPVPGTEVALNTTDQTAPTFQTRDFGPGGVTLGFRVSARCNGIEVATTTGNVTIQNVDRPPGVTALANPPIADAGELVNLTASATDPDNDPISLAWSQVANGAPAATLSSATGPAASFIAPAAAGDYTLEFQVTATSRLLTATATVLVNVSAVNLPPQVSLACPTTIDERTALLLDGSDSYDPELGPLTYAWSLDQVPVGIDFHLEDETGATVERTTPALGLGMDGGVVVRLRATDAQNQYADATCAFMINDATAPVLSLPAPAVLDAESAAGTLVGGYAVSALDNVEGEIGAASITCLPPAPHLFPLGPTTVDCSVSDSASNSSSGSFQITVADQSPPTLAPHDDVAVDATGPDGATVDYEDAIATDTVDAAPMVACEPPSGSVFPIGSSTVTCRATDHAGNVSDPVAFNVAVHDTPPLLTGVSGDLSGIEATSPAGAVASWPDPAATDAVDGSLPVTCLPPSGHTFGLGTTAVVCSATDSASNVVSQGFSVTVVDTQPPVLSGVSGDISNVEATSPAGASASWTAPTALDIVDGERPVTCTPASGSTFALGTTTVTCAASDTRGHEASATFAVTVVDTQPPVLSGVSGDLIGIEATSPAGASASWDAPTALDIVDGERAVTCAPASGSTFALGTTTVTCAASDTRGHEASATFTVTVVDTQPPVLSGVSGDISGVEATSPAGAVAGWTDPTALDIVDGERPVACTPGSGSTFALGTSTVTCSASDSRGNTASASFGVTVVDTTAPEVTPPADVTREATGPLTAVDFGSATATDAVGVTWLTHNAPALFPLGPTVITWTARDAAGNTATATSTVTVVDTTAPVLTVPGSVIEEATSAAGATVTFAASAVDLVSGPVAVHCSPASGSTFALGSTAVTCSATDAIGNTGHAGFTVAVRDTTAPTIAAHADVTATAGSDSRAVVNYTLPTASDLVDGLVPVSCTPAPGSSFTVGTTTVTCTAQDGRSPPNVAQSTTFKVIVSYAFNGFFQPIDNNATNAAKAGSAIPVKFTLGGNQGLDIFAAGSPTSQAVSCDTQAPVDEIETTVTAGGSTLQFDAGSGQYIYVWKSEKGWMGCRQLRVTLRDGSVRTAMFKFR